MIDDWLDSKKGRAFNSFVWAGIVLVLFQSLRNSGFIDWQNEIVVRLCIALMLWMAAIGAAIQPIYSSAIYMNTIAISIFSLALVGAIELTVSFVINGLIWPRYHYTAAVSVAFVPITMGLLSFRMMNIGEGRRSIRRVLSRHYLISLIISLAALLLGVARYWHILKQGLNINIQF